MPAFEYVALNADGRRKKGIIEGDSLRQVRQLLRDRGLAPLDIDPTSQETKTQEKLPQYRWWQRISALDLAIVTRQLATLINASLPIEEALNGVAQQSENRRISVVFMTVRGSVVQGLSFADALREFPSIFSPMYRSTVAAGEHSGHLDLVLENLAVYLEERYESRRNVEMALYYPIILFLCAIAIVGYLMTAVIPDIVKVFDNTGAELPGITVFLINTSEFLRDYAWLLFLIVTAMVFLVRYLLKLPRIRLTWDRIKLSWPLVGWISRGSNAARYANTLAILEKSGVPLVDAMRISSEVVTNQWIKTKLVEAVDIVSEGDTLRAALAYTGHFPPIFLHMVASGEASGELDSMLEKSAYFQQKELERTVETIVQLFRPLMLLVMAGLVLVIMLAVLLPILNLNQLVL